MENEENECTEREGGLPRAERRLGSGGAQRPPDRVWGRVRAQVANAGLILILILILFLVFSFTRMPCVDSLRGKNQLFCLHNSMRQFLWPEVLHLSSHTRLIQVLPGHPYAY